MSEYRVLRPARHIVGHFGDESFHAITCTGTDNSKQTRENTPKNVQNKQKINKLALGKKIQKKQQTKPKPTGSILDYVY